MTVQRILIVSGTDGNEINPVWAVKKFNREENSLNHGIRTTLENILYTTKKNCGASLDSELKTNG